MAVEDQEVMSPPTNSNEIISLASRVSIVEKDISELKNQLSLKATERENDLRFQSFEDKFQSMSSDIREVKEIIKDIVTRGEKDQKDTADELKIISDSIAKIQIGALVSIVVFFFTIVGTVVAFLITHTIH